MTANKQNRAEIQKIYNPTMLSNGIELKIACKDGDELLLVVGAARKTCRIGQKLSAGLLTMLCLGLGLGGSAPSFAQQEWYQTEPKSLIDDSLGFFATLASDDEKSEIGMNCRERKTNFFIRLFGTYAGMGGDDVNVVYRIGGASAVKARWRPSGDRKVLFAPDAIQFLRLLPDSGRVVIRVTDYQNVERDYTFSLHRLGEMRTKISLACKWKP